VEACEGVLDDTLVGISLRGHRKRHVVGRAELVLDAGGGGGGGRVATGHPGVFAGPFSFAQAQHAQNQALVGEVVHALRPEGRTVLELYCGSGNFTRAVGPVAKSVRAIDEDREAIAALERLARGGGVGSIDVRRSNVETALDRIEGKRERFDLALVDPPRTGLGRKLARRLTRIVDQRIVYVSCDPATLARDLEVFLEAGFVASHVRVFDLMPMTSEVETVVTLVRSRGGEGAR
jgi:23S rRNA (uracil1939-C5)-methyltransferase